MSLRLAILNAIKPLIEEVGTSHAPYSHRKITGYHYYSLLDILVPGMPLLTKKEGELSNLFIPGDVSHLATYVGTKPVLVGSNSFQVPFVVEATSRGVVETDLLSFSLSKDYIAACKPTFIGDQQLREIAKWCDQQKGSPYDYSFDPKNKAFYCSELWWLGCVKTTGLTDIFTKRTTLGVETVAPQDYLNATSKFSKVWDSTWLPQTLR